MAGLTNDVIFGAGIERETSAFNDILMINMINDIILRKTDVNVYNFYPGIDFELSELNLVEFNKLNYYPREGSYVQGVQLWWNDILLGDMVHYCEGNGNASREHNVYRDDRYASLDVIDDCARYMIDEFNRFFDGKVDVLFNADVSYVTNRGEDMFGLIKDGLIQFSSVKFTDDLDGIVLSELTMTTYQEVFNNESGLYDYAVKLMWNDIVITDYMRIRYGDDQSWYLYDSLVSADFVNHDVVNDCVQYICIEIEKQRNI